MVTLQVVPYVRNGQTGGYNRPKVVVNSRHEDAYHITFSIKENYNGPQKIRFFFLAGYCVTLSYELVLTFVSLAIIGAIEIGVS